MLEIFDRSRRRVAIAENAHGTTEDLKLNGINYLSFRLPFDDPKNTFCQPFWFVRRNGGELYRIMPRQVDISDAGTVEYQCESVLATLIDRVLYGYHHVGGYGVTTADCIRYVLGKQSDWVLAECDYSYQYEYGWEQENILSALFSIATPIRDYRWVTDTSVYPWRLSLKRLRDDAPIYVHNMISYAAQTAPQRICTRLYPLGYGEGINQLTIRNINGGSPYIQSPDSIIAKYGVIEKIWTDRRYEDPASLKAAAQVLLDELQEPAASYEIEFLEPVEVGRRAKYGTLDAFVTGVHREYGDVTRQVITICNHSTDIASHIADIADKLRTEQCYAQGATQIYGQALQANGSPDKPLRMSFIVPAEMRIVNGAYAKIRIGQFRAYSKTTDSVVRTTRTDDNEKYEGTTGEAGSGDYHTSEHRYGWPGYPLYTSIEGTGVTVAGSYAYTSGVDFFNRFSRNSEKADNTNAHTHNVNLGAHYHAFKTLHSHLFYGRHAHTLTLDSHKHSFTMADHAHSFMVPAHSHKATVPEHSHNITPGIYKFGNPHAFWLSVNGIQKQYFPGTDAELDLTAHLIGDNGKIPRDQWLTIEVRPDDLAYISIDLVFQGFVQSRGDATV